MLDSIDQLAATQTDFPNLPPGTRAVALPRITAPTLVIHGAADPLVPLACGVDTAQAIPNAVLHVIEGMGHALPITLWPRIVEAIAAHAGRVQVLSAH